MFSAKFYIFSSKFAYNLNIQQKSVAAVRRSCAKGAFLRTGHPCIFQARCRSGVGGANNFGGIVLSLTPKRHVGAEFSRRVAHPAASRHQIWGFAKNFCRCVVINGTIEKPLRRGGGVHTWGAYSPALQLATKALAASAAEV